MALNKRPRYQTIDGFCVPESYSPECFREALGYKPRPDDVFIATYPKCGTTWAQSILLLLFRKGEPVKTFAEFGQGSPYLEMFGMDCMDLMTRPGAIKTHLPFHMVPYSPEAKYIYVTRNPKDCCVSFYHHTRHIDAYDFTDGTFDEFFQLFITGTGDHGDYFDHVSSWYEHRDAPNILFLTYEDMKRDTRMAVMKIARFLGKDYEDMLQEDPAVMDNVLRYSSFQYMKEEFNNSMELLTSKLTEEEIDQLPLPRGLKHIMKYVNKTGLFGTAGKLEFVRKGVVGDWRNHFSLEQSEQVDRRFEETLGNTDLTDTWRKHMEWRQP